MHVKNWQLWTPELICKKYITTTLQNILHILVVKAVEITFKLINSTVLFFVSN